MKPDEAEEAWQACRKGVEGDTGMEALARRVYRLRYVHNGQEHEAVVGEKDAYDNALIMAIIAMPTHYKICNVVRGYMKVGATPMVGLGDVRDVEDFDV